MRVRNGLAVLTLAASIGILPASALDGRDIMQKAFDVKEPAFSHSAVRMDLIEKDGTAESRTVEEWGKKDADGLVSTVMAFMSPASVKNTRFLQRENKGRADDKWIYLPALRSTRRIASSEGDKSFMGTDATYDDMDTREVDADEHALKGEEKIAGRDCYVVESKAKDPAESQYSRRVSWIDKATWVPVKIEMYDKKGALLKVLTVEKLENVGGYWIPTEDLMENVQTGHSTRLSILKIEVDKPIAAGVFTPNFLASGR